MSYDNTNSGMLARNERKQKDSHPDFTGFINVDGVEYWLSGWTKEGKAGSKMEGKRFFSLSVQPKDEQRTQQRSAPPRSAPSRPAPTRQGFDDMDDDIPF